MLNLGNIARNGGDLAAAEAAFRGVIDSGDARLANKPNGGCWLAE